VKAAERAWWAVAFPILVAGAFFTPQLVTRSAPVTVEEPSRVESPKAAAPSAALDARDGPVVRHERGEAASGADGFMDLHGNEVTDAMATYTFDEAGSLYELHSPQTELPRLGIPKS
jgi:hypothetical protein